MAMADDGGGGHACYVSDTKKDKRSHQPLNWSLILEQVAAQFTLIRENSWGPVFIAPFPGKEESYERLAPEQVRAPLVRELAVKVGQKGLQRP